jgi:hypothetical protein
MQVPGLCCGVWDTSSHQNTDRRRTVPARGRSTCSTSGVGSAEVSEAPARLRPPGPPDIAGTRPSDRQVGQTPPRGPASSALQLYPGFSRTPVRNGAVWRSRAPATPNRPLPCRNRDATSQLIGSWKGEHMKHAQSQLWDIGPRRPAFAAASQPSPCWVYSPPRSRWTIRVEQTIAHAALADVGRFALLRSSSNEIDRGHIPNLVRQPSVGAQCCLPHLRWTPKQGSPAGIDAGLQAFKETEP